MKIQGKRQGHLEGVAAFLLRAVTLLFVVSVAVEGNRFVFRVQENGKRFFMIKDFALMEDYDSSELPSLCYCRRRCEVIPSCHSVSILTLPSGRVECRTSSRPWDVGEWTERPSLLHTPGAIHFLESDSSEWTDPEANGLYYKTYTRSQTQPKCDTGYEVATAKTPEQFELMKILYDKYTDGYGLWVGLRMSQIPDSSVYAPYWLASNSTSPTGQILYNETGLPASALQDTGSPGKWFFLKKSSADYVFTTQVAYNYIALCHVNKFNLFWG